LQRNSACKIARIHLKSKNLHTFINLFVALVEVENTKGKQSQEVGVGEKGDGKRNQGGGRGGGVTFS
jgi:hypothetical protein